jgi:hypothetical protein
MKIRSMFSLGAIVVLPLIGCDFQTIVAQQPTERVIRRLPVEENEPIAITSVKVDDQRILSNKKFYCG